MNYIYKTLFLLLFTPLLFGQQISPNAQISLITCGPGNDLYAKFGHSAIRLNDSINNIDWVFNYGTFDFDTPNFYLKFINGNLNYMLSVSKFDPFIRYYFFNKRTVSEQILDLNFEEKKKLTQLLIENAKPENKFYRYDFFFDNCATKIRDIVFKSIEGEIILHNIKGENSTFRNLFSSYLNNSTWTKFGIDILLGSKTDLQTDTWQEMFLPNYLDYHFKNAIVKRDSSEKPLIKTEKKIISFNNELSKTSFRFSPSIVFGILLICVILFSILFTNNTIIIRTFDIILFLATGLSGLLILYMWFFTSHQIVSMNYNILWANPLNILILWITQKKYFNSIFSTVIIIISVLLLVVFISISKNIPQELPNGYVVIFLLLLYRIGFYLFKNKYVKNIIFLNNKPNK
ncbi:MAG: DUF4105 domain-containing protein [Marinilabiliaceae bacterium]|nr:DUF4105 domain-containing protein [Marinilabiliaceae bacterium]